MPTRRMFLGLWMAFAMAIGIVTPAMSGYAGAPGGRLAVVVAKTCPLDELSGYDLKHLFLGEYVNGPGGKKLIPLVPPPNSPDRVGFDKVVLGMSADQAANYWIDRKIRGQSGAPKSIDSTDLMLRVVARLDGAVGYVRASDVTGDVKVLRIDGKMPGDAGYRVEY